MFRTRADDLPKFLRAHLVHVGRARAANEPYRPPIRKWVYALRRRILRCMWVTMLVSAGAIVGPSGAQGATQIANGTVVAAGVQRQLGLVTVNGGCSGTLLNQFWVLTARHCVTTTGTLTGPLASAGSVPVTATWAAGRTGTPSRIYEFAVNAPPNVPSRDIVLVYLGVADFGPAASQPISGPLTTADTVTQYGIGFSTFATGVFGTPTAVPATGFGVYRSARFTPSSINATSYQLAMNASNQVGHGGDSGGPTRTAAGIVGVQSTCTATGYIANAPVPRQWQWATGISACQYVRTGPFADEIARVTDVPPPGATTVAATGNADSGWDEYNVHDVVFYTKGSDVAVSGYFDKAGVFHTMGTTPGLAKDWTQIVGSPDYRRDGGALGPVVSDLLFYNKGTGQGVFARMNERGVKSGFSAPISEAPNCQKTFAFKVGWSQIVWSSAGLVFYDNQTGQVVTGAFNPGTCTFTNLHSQTVSGYTTMTLTRGNRVVFYNSGNGNGSTGYIDSAGFHQQRLYVGGFQRGWTNIVGDGSGDMLFYSGPSAFAVQPSSGLYPGQTGVLNSDGTFGTAWTNYQFGHWTDIIAWPASPNLLFFYNSVSGHFAAGKLNAGAFTAP